MAFHSQGRGLSARGFAASKQGFRRNSLRRVAAARPANLPFVATPTAPAFETKLLDSGHSDQWG
jgi:hypothetical protein